MKDDFKDDFKKLYNEYQKMFGPFGGSDLLKVEKKIIEFEVSLDLETLEIEENFSEISNDSQMNQITYAEGDNYYSLKYRVKDKSDITKDIKNSMYEYILEYIDDMINKFRDLKKTNKKLVQILRTKKINKIV